MCSIKKLCVYDLHIIEIVGICYSLIVVSTSTDILG